MQVEQNAQVERLTRTMIPFHPRWSALYIFDVHLRYININTRFQFQTVSSHGCTERLLHFTITSNITEY